MVSLFWKCQKLGLHRVETWMQRKAAICEATLPVLLPESAVLGDVRPGIPAEKTENTAEERDDIGPGVE